MQYLTTQTAHVLSSPTPGAIMPLVAEQEIPLVRDPENTAVMSMTRMGDMSEVEIIWSTTAFGPLLRTSIVTALVDYGKELMWAQHFVDEHRMEILMFFRDTFQNGQEVMIQ